MLLVTSLISAVIIIMKINSNSLSNYGIFERGSADETLKREIVAIRINLILVRVIVCLTISAFLHFSFQLPPEFVIWPVVKKFTTIWKKKKQETLINWKHVFCLQIFQFINMIKIMLKWRKDSDTWIMSEDIAGADRWWWK